MRHVSLAKIGGNGKNSAILSGGALEKECKETEDIAVTEIAWLEVKSSFEAKANDANAIKDKKEENEETEIINHENKVKDQNE